MNTFCGIQMNEKRQLHGRFFSVRGKRMPEVAEPEAELELPEIESVDDDVTVRSRRSIDSDYLASILEQLQEGTSTEGEQSCKIMQVESE